MPLTVLTRVGNATTLVTRANWQGCMTKSVTTSISTLTKHGKHTRTTFVGSKVHLTPLTEKIIDAVMPYFALNCRVIGGYLTVGEQYWKVNYHWELLVSSIEKFLKLKTVTERSKTHALAVWKVLMSNPPLPERGYLKDKALGDTVDQSPLMKMQERHKLLLQSKKDFRRILIAAQLINPAHEHSNPPEAEIAWWRALAKVAMPGTSNHGKGWALDITGNINEISRIAKALGASLVYPEPPHVHVEFSDVDQLLRVTRSRQF